QVLLVGSEVRKTGGELANADDLRAAVRLRPARSLTRLTNLRHDSIPPVLICHAPTGLQQETSMKTRIPQATLILSLVAMAGAAAAPPNAPVPPPPPRR